MMTSECEKFEDNVQVMLVDEMKDAKEGQLQVFNVESVVLVDEGGVVVAGSTMTWLGGKVEERCREQKEKQMVGLVSR